MNQFGKSHTAQRLSNISSDLSLNYLGYWTDNGKCSRGVILVQVDGLHTQV